MVYRVTAQADTFELEALDDAIAKAPEFVNSIINKSILPKFRDRIKRELAGYPPIWRGGKRRWANDNQRKAVMAKLRKQGGPPYRRRGRIGAGWRVTFKPLQDGAEIEISNIAREVATNTYYAVYVIGDRQQLMHKDTGWIQVEEKIQPIEADLTDAIADVYFAVIDSDRPESVGFI